MSGNSIAASAPKASRPFAPSALADNNIASFYVRYLGRLGARRFRIFAIAQPPRLGAAEGAPAVDPGVARDMAYWVAFPLGLALALLTVWWRAPGADLVPAHVLSGLCLAVPAAVIALVFLWMGPWIGQASRWAIALVVFPHVYRYAKNQLVATSQSPHVVAAAGQGIEQLARAVGARFHSRGAATGGAGRDLGEPGLWRVHPHRSDLRHVPASGNWPGARRSIAICRCWSPSPCWWR